MSDSELEKDMNEALFQEQYAIKQRGLYSEYLGRSSESSRDLVSSGPTHAKLIGGNMNTKKSKNQRSVGQALHQPNARAFVRNMAIKAHLEGLDISYEAKTTYLSSDRTSDKVEPKVIVPFKQRVGKPPRRIEIERKKRMYASQNLEELLLAEGINYQRFGLTKDHLTQSDAYLPLHIFDDTDYELREPTEWICLGTDSVTGEVHIPARSLDVSDGTFQACDVVGYNAETNKFSIVWKQSGETEEIYRVFLLFDADDPFTWVKRVSSAHKSRREMESLIRYSLFVDSMPIDEIQLLDAEQVNRILLLALNTKDLKQNALDTSSLLHEVNIDYARTMNKIIFDSNFDNPAQEYLKELAKYLPKEEQIKPRWRGVVDVPFHDFPKHFSDFCFHSFYTKIEAILSLVKVNAECLALEKMSLYNTNISKSVRLDEFVQLQTSNAVQISSFLQDKWALNLKNCIKSSLSEVGKGWLNLEEENREVYQFSKLKKLMMMVNFMMQDRLRDLVHASIQKYKSFFVKACNYEVLVRGLSNVSVVPCGTPEADVLIAEFEATALAAQNPPATARGKAEKKEFDEKRSREKNIPSKKLSDYILFVIDLQIKQDKVVYSTPLGDLMKGPLDCFDKGLQALHNIGQLETTVMENLFWHGNDDKLAVVEKNEPFVMHIFEDIKKMLHNSLLPLEEYLELFTSYKNVLELDVDDYVSNFLREDLQSADVEREITKIQEAKDKLLDHVPKQIWLGMVLVNCEEVRHKLSRKYDDIMKKELDYFSKLTRSRCQEIDRYFTRISQEIKKPVENIRDLVALKEFMAKVPEQVKSQEKAIENQMLAFELFDNLHYKLVGEMSRLKWNTFSHPKMIDDQMNRKEAGLSADREDFLNTMRTEQEEFKQEVSDLQKKVSSFGLTNNELEKRKKILEKVEKLQDHLVSVKTRAEEFNSNEIMFSLPTTNYAHVNRLSKTFEPHYNMWTVADEWLSNYDSWMNEGFMSLDGDDIQVKVMKYSKLMTKVSNSAVIKENQNCLNIAQAIKSEIDTFRPYLPLIIALRNPGMRDRHWTALSAELPFSFSPDDTLTLTKVVDDLKLQGYIDLISKIGDSAGKEFQIEQALDKMEKAWGDILFEIIEYKDTQTYIVKTVDDIMTLLDEHIVMTQAMQFSAFKKPFEERINKWSEKLNTVQGVIEEWLQVQSKWMSLQSIFANADINRQLPQEGKRFASVNKSWRLIMSQVHANPDVLNFCDNPGLLQKLTDNNKLLQSVQKRLNDYLDKKRAAFTRFYFLANKELLDILSQTQEPRAVQPHLKKTFENIAKLEFDDNTQIRGMYSSEGERIPFTESIDPTKKNVEFWLGDVEQGMKSNVKHQLNLAVADYKNVPRRDWVRKWPGQCVLNGSQINWTREVENSLRKGGHRGITRYGQKLHEQLTEMVDLVRGKLTPIQRLIMGALIVLDVHARDVVDRLAEKKVSAVTDFDWIMQMRYYWDEQQVWVQMVQSRFPYGYEYLGNSLRLVITPLTDRCYITLMAALQLHLGGSPAGPAGTGKTETVKDLAKACAKQCVVFNCSEGLNYHAMGKFFKGLASAGAWACFDEFNRIYIEVLSVVAMQIMTIWDAVRENAKTFLFEGSEIRLDPTCSVFITMNPGYAGRTELPDNLKALFRPVAMMVPDYALIAEIFLYSFGFDNAKSLARKMVTTFSLCSQQLSVQDHYDYGMRAVATVIARAGILKTEDSEMNEDLLLLKALRDVNVPKFLEGDLPLFEGIISDLFPTISKPDEDYGILKESIMLSCDEHKLQPVDSFLMKCLQLYETTVVRHGLMLVGPTGGGKTSCLKTLSSAITRLREMDGYEQVKVTTINPKAVTMGQLYGYSDPMTKEWSDGILANIVRSTIEEGITDPSFQWIVFDGPVDALWIENMNTVLDDNKKLCLFNGEMLSLNSKMRMIFEVEDLTVASPATVSRLGMVYMEPSVMGFNPLIVSYVENIHETFESLRPTLMGLFDTLLAPCIQFIKKQTIEPIESVPNNLCRSLMNLLDAIFIPLIPEDGVKYEYGDELEKVLGHITSLFLECLIWSVGASCDQQGRIRFSAYLQALLKECNIQQGPITLENKHTGLVYDYSFSLKEAKWVPWSKTQPAFEPDTKLSFSEMIVPTMDSIRYTQMLKKLLFIERHVLFTGSTGTGKTVNVNRYLSSLNDTSQLPLSFMFSAATSANQVEDYIFQQTQNRRRRVVGPPLGKHFVIFVDDLNMPAREEYFAQPPIELLRQFVDSKGLYNRHQLEFVQIVDCSFVCAMGPPGGGRNPITARFTRHFNQIAHTEIEEGSLRMIFSTIVDAFMTKFKDEVREISTKIVKATIDVYQSVSENLLPTPARSHYTFNLRDLSAVFQGILSGNHRSIITSHSFLRLWIHENRRVFRDRLINDEDRDYVDSLLANIMSSQLDCEWKDVVTQEPLLFGDYMDGSGAENRNYDEVSDLERCITCMEDYLNEYNEEEETSMKLVMFLDAIEHVSRISRILRQPGGNALLLGVGGSGRSSLSKLATKMAEYEIFQIEITKNYGMNEWHDDIKRLLLEAGLKEQPIVFVVTDSQINDKFLEEINNILNSGDVPNLYNAEDMDNIYSVCKIECKRRNIVATKLNVFNQFILRVKANLHVILCMSPMGTAFRTRLRMFPSLVNCCTIDWFSKWPTEALKSVATTALQEEDDLPFMDSIVNIFQTIHQGVDDMSSDFAKKLGRYNYVTPTSYLELLNVFTFLLQEKRDEVGKKKKKLQYGLDTLHSAGEAVAKLRVELKEKQPRLVETQQEVETTMQQIAIDRKAASATMEVVEKQENEASVKAAECKEIKEDAQSDLDKALPLLDKAVECLRELKKPDIDEIKNFKKPHANVVLTMEAACIMLKSKMKFKIMKKADPNNMGKTVYQYWATAQKYLLANPTKLLEILKSYDRDSIPEKLIKEIEPYIANPNFAVKAVENTSKACRAICMWVHAMHGYYLVSQQVEPKRVRLREAEEELEKTMHSLNEARERLAQVQLNLANLTEKYESLVQESESLQDEVEMCRIKIERSNKLVGGLGGEKVRWGKTIVELEEAYKNIPGDVIIAAGTIAYLGAFTSSYRKLLVDEWRGKLVENTIPHTPDCDIRQILGDPVKIRAWQIAGLPTDAISTENGIIMSKARRWPLMIDPQGQASKFIKKLGDEKFEESGMDVVKMTDKGFVHALENAIRFGRWLLIDSLGEELDPVIEPLLLQQVISINSQPHIKVGDNPVPFNDQFHLYLCTRLPNPHYQPETQVKVTLLNFTITPAGLEDQMLGTVVAKESPDTEQRKNALVVQNARMQQSLQETEDTILRLLSESKGDVLEDEELIDTLASSQKTSVEINESVAKSKIIEAEIDAKRQKYIPIAVRSSLLYFCIAELSSVDPMYQYSLQWFISLFTKSIEEAPMSEDINVRLQSLIDYFTYSLYQNVCRSLFEVHKTLFSFLLTVRIKQGETTEINPTHWRFLIAGAAPKREIPNPSPDWITASVWRQIIAFSDLEEFAGFDEFFTRHLQEFKMFFDSAAPHLESLPAPWDEKLDVFQRLLVLKCLRPDKINPAIRIYIENKMGEKFNNAPAFDLEESFKSSSPLTPLIFILSRGADPAAKFFQFASQCGFRDKTWRVSLGQGQGETAQKYIEEAMRKGGWVLLQNCHLSVSWLPTLEQICNNMDQENLPEDFRLWLTSSPTPSFPVSILQNGIKLTDEAPKGLRANMIRSYMNFSDTTLTQSSVKKPEQFQKLLYSLCFFHAVVLDRKKFGALGWNIAYEFTEEDLNVSITQLAEFIDMYKDIPYKVIHFLVYDINYGGRVTDDIDRRTIRTILHDFINPKVLKDDYSFSLSGKYLSLPTGNREYYLEEIEKLEAVPHPEVFGMHENADITAATEDTYRMFGTILSLLTSSVDDGKKSREEIIAETANSILERTPHEWEMDIIQKKYPTRYSQSMNTVLVQEAIRYNKLLNAMRTSLVDLQKALKGQLVMTEELEKMSESLFNNLVPLLWSGVAYPSLMPLAAWVDNLLQRIEFIGKWIDNGIPSSFWISGLTFPQAFLTGTLQNYARTTQKPIDAISFGFEVMNVPHAEIKSGPEHGVYIYGMFLEGARWDANANALVDSRPKELFTPLPVLWLRPMEERQAPETGVYFCPVYKILTRQGTLSTTGHSTNYVMSVELPSLDPESKWIKAGVALFCALRY